MSRTAAACVFIYSMRLNISPQIWDETFQRVTDEQEIYEGDLIQF